MSEANSHMEERNVLRQMERERRNQEVKPEVTPYDAVVPLFSQPYKTVKDDELSSRIQMMLGSYEDGESVVSVEPVTPCRTSQQSPPTLNPSTPLATSTPRNQLWLRSTLPALPAPVEPLSPLLSSESERSPGLASCCRPLLSTVTGNFKAVGLKKPTAYVRPMDGQDQMTTPALKASEVFCRDGECVEEILREMCVFPSLLSVIHTPVSAEIFKSPSPAEELLKVPPNEAVGSSVRAQQEPQGDHSSESGTSDTDSERSSDTEKPENTQDQSHELGDCGMGRCWNPVQEQHQPDHENHSEVTQSDSQPIPIKTETEPQPNPNINTEDGHQCFTGEDKPPSSPRATESMKNRAGSETSVSVRSSPALVVKIQLKLLSRIPSEMLVQPRRSAHKRCMEESLKPHKKKQKVEKRSSSSQLRCSGSGGQEEKKRKTSGVAGKKEKRSSLTIKARPLLPPDHRKRSVPDQMREAKKLKHKADATLDTMAKALFYLEAAMLFVESAVGLEAEPQTPKSSFTMLSETVDLIKFILRLKNYAEPCAAAHERDFCVLCLRCESLVQMNMFRSRRASALRHSRTLTEHFRNSSRTPSNSATRSSSSSPSPVDSPAADGTVLLPRLVQQAMASYVSITGLFLSAQETWEQAQDLSTRGSGLLRELDSALGPLSLTSSFSTLVRYTRHGLHWIRLDTQSSH